MPIEKTPSYIRIRVANPKQFARFRIKKLGKGIKAVIGFMKKGGSKIQSLMFPRSRYTLTQAKAWVKKHDYHIEESFWVTDISIEPETLDLVLEETVATDDDEVPPMDVIKITKDDWAWLTE